MSFSFKHAKKTLCENCHSAHRVTDSQGRTESFCHSTGNLRRVPEIVVACSDYSFAYADAPYHMKEKAWVLAVDKKADFIGFRPPNKDKHGRVQE